MTPDGLDADAAITCLLNDTVGQRASGRRRPPPRYLTADDVLVTRIDGLGELRTRFR